MSGTREQQHRHLACEKALLARARAEAPGGCQACSSLEATKPVRCQWRVSIGGHSYERLSLKEGVLALCAGCQAHARKRPLNLTARPDNA